MSKKPDSRFSEESRVIPPADKPVEQLAPHDSAGDYGGKALAAWVKEHYPGYYHRQAVAGRADLDQPNKVERHKQNGWIVVPDPPDDLVLAGHVLMIRHPQHEEQRRAESERRVAFKEASAMSPHKVAGDAGFAEPEHGKRRRRIVRHGKPGPQR